MINILIWLVVGGVIGWFASLLMRNAAQQDIVLNILVGLVGGVLGGWIITPLIGAGTINQGDFSLPALGVSFLGALILLAGINLIRRGVVR